MYALWNGKSKSVKVEKDFNMELVSYVVNEDYSLTKGKVTRRIDYFILESLVNLLLSYDNIPNKVMEHVLKYKAERDEEFYQKHGNLIEHDDANIANLLEHSDEEIIDIDDDLPEEEEQTRPSQERQTKAAHDQSVEEMKAKILSKYKSLNKTKSEEPNFQPCVLESPMRIKQGREEIYLDNFHKLKTSRRKGEDSKLDRARRSTLNSFLGRRFKLDQGTLQFRIYVFGQEMWMDLNDAQQVNSRTAQQYIDEIKDDAFSPMEISMVDGLRRCVVEALKREGEARQKRRSQA
ncbi:hypothetical protein POM88_021627 [Heracleum sosnowskyi]|uniref:Uncharacterized protein n=1 Tax=Heracleum sosnowskyi TaxID=360622 RepID=A0AAD8IG67_9APIA|nr:hypothetical protein POM88_021627 [Heracleum sosnowskyi]